MFASVSRKLNLTRLLPKAAPKIREQRRVGREHFIPVRPTELVDELVRQSDFDLDDQYSFRSLCCRLETTFHNESRQRLLKLQDIYTAVNPDLDTDSLSGGRVSALDLEIAVSGLFEHLRSLLQRANFKQLTREEVERSIGNASALGVPLDLDLSRFDELAVFARGRAAVTVSQRKWKQWYRSVDVDVPMYQRLVVVFRLKATETDGESVKAAYMRLFKNVPQQDIDMLLPGGKVRISLLDRGKIIVPTISGVGLATFKLGLLFFAGIYGLLKIAGLIGGALGSGWKSVNGYWKTKNKYELSLTRNLYYQNLDNNAGVLLRLSTEAERQEFREAVLGYFVLLKANRPCTTHEMAKSAEATLMTCGVDVDFEVEDAITKLVRMELCRQTSMGCWVAVSLKDATKSAIARNLQEALRS